MKICILSDCHIGVKNSNFNFSNMMDDFFTETFFPYLKEHNIKTIIQLGDLYDVRRSINYSALSECKRFLFDPLKDAGITFHTIVGNHDIFYRDSLEINSQSLLLNEYENIFVYDEPASINIDGTTIDMIPWICKDNEEKTFNFIKNSKSDLCCGHLELKGFQMYKGVDSHGGLATDIFARYEAVYSGHYHSKSTKGNIHYLGTPYQMSWSDYLDPKGFHIFDTDTRQLEFILTPIDMFIRYEYNDELIDYNNFDISPFLQKYIKIVVIKKTDFYIFDRFLRSLYEANTYEIKILEDLSDFSEGIIDTERVNIEDTLDVLEHYIESVSDESNNTKIKEFMKGLYLEAIGVQE